MRYCASPPCELIVSPPDFSHAVLRLYISWGMFSVLWGRGYCGRKHFVQQYRGLTGKNVFVVHNKSRNGTDSCCQSVRSADWKTKLREERGSKYNSSLLRQTKMFLRVNDQYIVFVQTLSRERLSGFWWTWGQSTLLLRTQNWLDFSFDQFSSLQMIQTTKF